MRNPHEAHVQTGVAVQDVAELMGNHALKLVAIQQLQAAAGNTDGHVALGVTGGEGIYAPFVIQDVNLGHGQARGDGHLFDDVAQLLLVGLRGAGLDAPATEQFRHHGPAGGELADLAEAAQGDGQSGTDGKLGEEARLPGPFQIIQWTEHGFPQQPEEGDRRIVDTRPMGQRFQKWQGEGGENEIGQDDDHHHRRCEINQQPPGLAAGVFLLFEEIHQSVNALSRNAGR